MDDVVAVHIPRETVNDDRVLILRWMVTDNQPVESGQALAEIETSKTTIDVFSPIAGFVRLNARAKAEVPIEHILCYVGSSLEAATAKSMHDQTAGSTTQSQPLPVSSVIRTPSGAASSAVPSCSAAVDRSNAESSMGKNAVELNQSVTAKSTRLSHKAMACLMKHRLSLDQFAGAGLVREKDVLRLVSGNSAQTAHDSASHRSQGSNNHQTPPRYRLADGVPFQKRPLQRSKRIESRILSWSQQQAIRSRVSLLVPTAGRRSIQRVRPDIADAFVTNLIQACARSLKQMPMLNACCLDEHVIEYERVNIGYAIDAGNGLKVVVIHEADRKTDVEIESERQRFIVAYLNQSLRPADLAGATFTISDLSETGVTSFDPLISEGQAAILGIGGERETGRTQKAFPLFLSFDHRLIEGRTAINFLRDIRDKLVDFELGILGTTTNDSAEASCSRCGIHRGRATEKNHFLVSVAGPQNSPQFVCTICLQGR